MSFAVPASTPLPIALALRNTPASVGFDDGMPNAFNILSVLPGARLSATPRLYATRLRNGVRDGRREMTGMRRRGGPGRRRGGPRGRRGCTGRTRYRAFHCCCCRRFMQYHT